MIRRISTEGQDINIAISFIHREFGMIVIPSSLGERLTGSEGKKKDLVFWINHIISLDEQPVYVLCKVKVIDFLRHLEFGLIHTDDWLTAVV